MDAEYVEAVLDLADRVPRGRATTYGLIAEVLRERLGRGGPRMVGQAMARAGGAVPWWRVVNASGEPPAAYRGDAVRRLRAEGVVVDKGRVRMPATDGDLDAALWGPARG